MKMLQNVIVHGVYTCNLTNTAHQISIHTIPSNGSVAW
jgi:hypothetical protein